MNNILNKTVNHSVTFKSVFVLPQDLFRNEIERTRKITSLISRDLTGVDSPISRFHLIELTEWQELLNTKARGDGKGEAAPFTSSQVPICK